MGLVCKCRLFLTTRVLCLSLLLLTFISFVDAQAQSHEITSRNFVMSGDVSAEDGSKLLEKLETYRSALFHIYGLNYQDEAKKIPILVLKDVNEFTEVTGNKWASGIYVRAFHGYMFAMLSGEDLQVSQAAKHIAVHEYTHHFLSTYIPNEKPQWYHEGLAEYLASFELDPNGEIKTGLPIYEHLYVLNEPGWLTMVDMINSLANYPMVDPSGAYKPLLGDPYSSTYGPSRAEFFYAQSWLMVHYLRNHPDMQVRFDKFNNSVSALDNTVALFEQIIGMSPLEFEDVLRDYLKQDDFQTMTYVLPPNNESAAIEVKALSESSRAIKLLAAMSIFGNLHDLEDKTETLFTIANSDSSTKIDTLLLRVMMDLDVADNDAALLKLNEASELDNNNARVHLYTGYAKLNKSMELPIESYADEAKYIAAVKSARSTIKKSIDLDADLIGSKCMYAMSSDLAGNKPDALAVNSAEACVKFLSGRKFARQNLSLVPALIHGKKYSLANNIIRYGLEMDDEYTRKTARDYSFELEEAQEK